MQVERGSNVAFSQVAIDRLDQIGDLKIDQAADDLMPGEVIQSVAAASTNAFVDNFPQCDAIQLGGCDHSGTQAIIQVVRSVCQFIGNIGDLGFKAAA